VAVDVAAADVGSDPEKGMTPELPDGIFAYQKCKFWYILRPRKNLILETFAIFYGHLIYFIAI
jgi:hypothetical protein